MSALLANKLARERAEQVMQMIDGDLLADGPRFWECLQALVADKLPPKLQPVDRFPPLNDAEATRFEAMSMPYGKHAGETVGQVPCDYLLFLTEGDEFSQRLKRYVKSKRFQERQGD